MKFVSSSEVEVIGSIDRSFKDEERGQIISYKKVKFLCRDGSGDIFTANVYDRPDLPAELKNIEYGDICKLVIDYADGKTRPSIYNILIDEG